jgi:predicted protein tyrosine phosphatase
MPLFQFAICSRTEVPRVAAALRATHLVTFIDPGDLDRVPVRPESVEPVAHLVIECRDTRQEIAGGPTVNTVGRLLAFTEHLRDDSRPLFQCEAGISRSAAGALAAVSQHVGPGRASRALAWVLSAQPFAWPNRDLVRLASDLLGHPDLLRTLDQYRAAQCRLGLGEIF